MGLREEGRQVAKREAVGGAASDGFEEDARVDVAACLRDRRRLGQGDDGDRGSQIVKGLSRAVEGGELAREGYGRSGFARTRSPFGFSRENGSRLTGRRATES